MNLSTSTKTAEFGFGPFGTPSELRPSKSKINSKTIKTSSKGVSSKKEAKLKSVPRAEGAAPARTAGRHEARSSWQLYFDQVRVHALLSREEEHTIAVKFAETGDRMYADRLIRANLRLVAKIALEYRAAHTNLMDLIQEGNVGLIHAVNKYDPHRGIKLITYASWWIRAYMLKFILSNSRLVKVGTTQAQRRLFFGLNQERARLTKLQSEPVGAKQLAAAMNVREQDVIEMERRMSGADASLDAPVGTQDGDRPRGDLLSAEGVAGPDVQTEESEFQAKLKIEIQQFGKTLAGRDLKIFESRLLTEEAATLAEIAGTFGVSRERVRQLEERLKKNLRLHLQSAFGDALPA
jgi:RNA polymerase sigma-32 factor